MSLFSYVSELESFSVWLSVHTYASLNACIALILLDNICACVLKSQVFSLKTESHAHFLLHFKCLLVSLPSI